MMSSAHAYALLMGPADITELREPPSKVIRVYLCSAGTDTLRERDALVEKVYPKLRHYCRQNYGLEFQIVDMRWGLEDSWDDYSTDRQLCLYELQQCLTLSAGPAFGLILGQKYGERQLPVHIPAEHFELIKTALRRHKNRDTRDAFQLDQWYAIDENTVPAMYVLQKEDDVKRNLRPQTAVEKAIYGERDKVDWVSAKPDLKRLIKKGLQYCTQEGNLVDTDLLTYLVSDFEVEIRSGLQFSNDQNSNSEVFVRDIIDLKNYVNHPSAAKFMEVVYDADDTKFRIDSEAALRLAQIREEGIHRWLPNECISSFSVLWKEDNGISVELHKDYLEQVCTTFEEKMRASVDRLASEAADDTVTNLELEVHQHWLVAKKHYDAFVGRGELLSIIKAYVMSDDCKPLVVHGDSGVGKTAILAKSSVETSSWFGESVITITRFLDGNTDIRLLLYNICTQIAILNKSDQDTIPTAGKALHGHFLQLLDSVPDDKNLVIYLDALQHLALPNGSHDLEWMPTVLKSNVKLVVSTSSQKLLETLQTKVVNDDNNFLEITPMTEVECLSMLMAQLHAESRTLTNEQQHHLVNNVFSLCSLPLYTKLIMLQARQWTADVNLACLVFPNNCSEYVASVFRLLEEKHGSALTRKAISYLTASGTGLSDCEMEDILSLDDEVLNEALPKFITTVHRIPPLLWLRLKYDLKDFIQKKQSEGVTVYNWTHHIFAECCNEMYLNSKLKVDIHSLLADCHLGTWATCKKPFTRPSSANNNEVKGEADRLVPTQPLTFESSDTITRYNIRKYEQVPRHLLRSGRLKELNDLVIFNYDWMYNKTKAISLDQVLTDFRLNPGVEASLLEKALKDAQLCISKDINNMAAEISGRLLPYYNTHPYIRKLIQECDTAGVEHSAFIPNFPYQQVPGSPLKYSIKTNGPLTDMTLMGYEGRYALSKNQKSHSIQVYDLVTGHHEADIFSSVGNMYLSPNGERTVIVDRLTEKTLKIHETKTGEFLGQLIPLNQIQLKPKEKYKLSNVSVSNDHVCVIATTEKSYLFIADLMSCKFLQVLGLEGRSTICQITPDARYVFCNSHENLLAYDLNTLQNVTNTTLEHKPKMITFNSNTSRAFVINGIENRLFMLTLSDGGVDFLYKVLLQDSFGEDTIQNITLSNSENMLLAQGKSNLVVYEITSEKVQCHFKRPDDIPLEFKLPSSHYMDIHFTNSTFSPDDKFVIASIFRNVYIWNTATNRLMASLQAPVGLIEHLLVPADRGQIITQSSKSDIIQVWQIGEAIGSVGMLDCLTTPVEDIILTADDKNAFVMCHSSDEIGIFDMTTGKLSDLLTHDGSVKQMTVTNDGKYVFASLTQGKNGLYNKIWYTPERKVIYEFGNATAITVSLEHENTVFTFCQEEGEFKTPYKLSRYELADDNFSEYKMEQEMNFMLCQPFITPEDKYLITLTADAYEDRVAQHVNPTICAISLDSNMTMNTYSTSYLQQTIKISRILHIRPYPNNSYTIVCLYTNEPDPDEFTNKPYSHCCGFMILDICSGIICQVLEEFVSPQSPLDGLLFTDDVSLCIDQESNIFDMGTGYFMKQLYDTRAMPCLLALHGRVVVYHDKTYIFAVRLSDQNCIGHVDVHGCITKMVLCHDQRTIVVGCRDGSINSYVISDNCYDRPESVITEVSSRKGRLDSPGTPSLARTWDKVDIKHGPAYSRPPSAMVMASRDREMLQKVKPVSRSKSTIETLNYMSTRSRTCVLQ